MDRILNLTETNDVLNGGLLIVTCVVYLFFFPQYNQDHVRERSSSQRSLRESLEIESIQRIFREHLSTSDALDSIARQTVITVLLGHPVEFRTMNCFRIDTRRYFDPIWVWQIWQQAGGRAGVSSCEGLLINGWTGPGHEECLGCEMGGRWGGDTWGTEQRSPAPAQQHTGLSVAPQPAQSEHLRVWILWLWRRHYDNNNDDILSDNSVLWYLQGFEWKKLRQTNERLEKLMPYKYSNTICDVIEIQDKSLFEVQKASQVEKFTIVVGWRSISSEGRRRLRSTRSWFIPGNLSQPNLKALCGVNFRSAFNQNPIRRGVYEWCSESEVYNWFCWMTKWNIWNQSSWVSGIGCQTILSCKIVSIRPRLACFICNQFEQ